MPASVQKLQKNLEPVFRLVIAVRFIARACLIKKKGPPNEVDSLKITYAKIKYTGLTEKNTEKAKPTAI